MFKRLSCLILALVLMITPLAAINVSASVGSDAAEGVVLVYSQYHDGAGNLYYDEWGSGFGVAYEKGSKSVDVGEVTDLFVTNRHVVTYEDSSSTGSYTVADKVYLVYTDDALKYTDYYDVDGNYLGYGYDAETSRMVLCTVVGYSTEFDCAILRADSTVSGRVALEIAESCDEANAGDKVFAVGYPGLSSSVFDAGELLYSEALGQYYLTRSVSGEVSASTITQGIISRIGNSSALSDYMGSVYVIGTDAVISSGNSGGPLVHEDGKVIGINTYSISGSSVYYAIDVAYAIELAEDNGYTIKTGSSGVNLALIIGIIAAVVVIIVLVIVIVALATKNKKPAQKNIAMVDPAPNPTPTPTPVPAPAPVNDPTAKYPRVQCTAGALVGKRYPITGILRMGRNPNCNEIIIPGDASGVSGVHCQLEYVNGIVYLKDLGSTYGTYLEGKGRLAANQPMPVKVGDRFYLGSKNEMFEIVNKGGTK
ncbi:MAG: trypsin-like peptidase domain-containing protein [Oscillospiraceae bacterium]|nr:trypsin-like peptidase domain-containing protein [Oscillospiraceae bacterium]